MSRINKLISTAVLICFVFNTAVSDLAFAQALNFFAHNSDKLAVLSKFDSHQPIENKDIADLEMWFMACMKHMSNEGWEITLENIEKYRKLYDKPEHRLPGNSLFHPEGAQFMIDSAEEEGGVIKIKARRKDSKNGLRTYWIEYKSESQELDVYADNKDKQRSAEDALAIEAYRYHQRLDEVIAFAHENGLAKEPYNYRDGRKFFPAILRNLCTSLRLEIINPYPGKILPIEERKLVLIPLNERIILKLREDGVLGTDAKGAQSPIAKIVYEGRLVDISCYMTSSNNAIHAFVSPEIYRDAVIKTGSDDALMRLDRYIIRYLAHEIGVMCGSEYSIEDENGSLILKNMIDRIYAGADYARATPFSKRELRLVDLDHVKGRDYATNIPVQAPVAVVRKPGKSPKDVFAVMAASKRFWYSEFSPLDYIAAYKSYTEEHEGWDPDFTEEDFRKIFQANHDSFLKKGYIVTVWRGAGLRFKLTPSGRQEAGIKELANMTAAPAAQIPDDDNGSFKCDGLTVVFNVIPDRTVDRTFPFSNKQIIDGLSRCAGSTDGNLDTIMGRGSIQSIQFSSSGEGFAAGYVVVLDKIGTKIELCVKAKGLPDNLITGTITAPGTAPIALEASTGISTISEGDAILINLINALKDYRESNICIKPYVEYVDNALKAVYASKKTLELNALSSVYTELLSAATILTTILDSNDESERSFSRARKEEIIRVRDIVMDGVRKFKDYLDAAPDKSQVVAPKASAPAARPAMTVIPVASGPSQSAIISAERSFDVLYTSEQRSGVGVISLQYLQGVARDLKAGLLQNRLEKVFGLLGRVKAVSKNPACKAMASQVIADYNRITVNPTGMMDLSAPETAVSAVFPEALVARNENGTFAQEPGKSPENALKVIAATPKLRDGEFTLEDYQEAYRVEAVKRGWNANISYSTVRNDLYESADSLNNEGYIKITNMPGRKKIPLKFRLTLKGKKAIAIESAQPTVYNAAPAKASGLKERSFNYRGMEVRFTVHRGERTFPYANSWIEENLKLCVTYLIANPDIIRSEDGKGSFEFNTGEENVPISIILRKIENGAAFDMLRKGASINARESYVKGTIIRQAPEDSPAAESLIANRSGKPGNSPEDALKVIAATPKLMNDTFTVNDFLAANRSVAKSRGWGRGISMTSAQKILYMDENSLKRNGYIDYTISHRPIYIYIFNVTEKGRRTIKGIQIVEELLTKLGSNPAITSVKEIMDIISMGLVDALVKDGPRAVYKRLSEIRQMLFNRTMSKTSYSIKQKQDMDKVGDILVSGMLEFFEYFKQELTTDAPAQTMADWYALEKKYPDLQKVRAKHPDIMPVVEEIFAAPELTGLSPNVKFFPGYQLGRLESEDEVHIEFFRDKPGIRVYTARIGFWLKYIPPHASSSDTGEYNAEILLGSDRSFGVLLSDNAPHIPVDAFKEVREYLSHEDTQAVKKFAAPTKAKVGRPREPGKSPEDALKVIAATPKLRDGEFTLEDYKAAYKVEAAKRGWDTNIADNTARNDLYKSADSLEITGFVERINEKDEPKNAELRFRLTDEGENAASDIIEATPLPAPETGSNEAFGEKYSSLFEVPGRTLFKYEVGEKLGVIKMISLGASDSLNFEGAHIAAFEEKKRSFRRVDIPPLCARKIGMIREATDNNSFNVFGIGIAGKGYVSTISIPVSGTEIIITSADVNEDRLNIKKTESPQPAVNTVPRAPEAMMASEASEASPAPSEIVTDTGFTSQEAAPEAALAGDLEQGIKIIRKLQTGLYDLAFRNPKDLDATVALFAIRDGLIESMREGYNPETVYQRLFELYKEMDANGEVAGIIAASMQIFAANFTESGSASEEIVAEDLPATEPAQNIALPSVISYGESGLDGILMLVPIDWIDGALDISAIHKVVCEANAVVPENLSVPADDWDKNLGLIFSEKVTFGELLGDGSYEEGLGVLLLNIIRSEVRVAVVATTDKQRALIEEINTQIPDAKQRIVYGATAFEAKLKLKGFARFCYFKTQNEKAVEGIPSIDIIIKNIIRAIGKIVNITDQLLIQQMHEAARRFAEAA